MSCPSPAWSKCCFSCCICACCSGFYIGLSPQTNTSHYYRIATSFTQKFSRTGHAIYFTVAYIETPYCARCGTNTERAPLPQKAFQFRLTRQTVSRRGNWGTEQSDLPEVTQQANDRAETRFMPYPLDQNASWSLLFNTKHLSLLPSAFTLPCHPPRYTSTFSLIRSCTADESHTLLQEIYFPWPAYT